MTNVLLLALLSKGSIGGGGAPARFLMTKSDQQHDGHDGLYIDDDANDINPTKVFKRGRGDACNGDYAMLVFLEYSMTVDHDGPNRPDPSEREPAGSLLSRGPRHVSWSCATRCWTAQPRLGFVTSLQSSRPAGGLPPQFLPSHCRIAKTAPHEHHGHLQYMPPLGRRQRRCLPWARGLTEGPSQARRL